MRIRVADEAWLATALLHRERPEAPDFKLKEIHERARQEFRDDRPGVWYHIVSHCVASKPPSPAQYRMLHETGRGRRRLYRPADPAHPKRKGKIHPDKDDVPLPYRSLVDWYLEEFAAERAPAQGSSNPAVLVNFVGAIPAFDLQRITEAVHAGCEQVDRDEW